MLSKEKRIELRDELFDAYEKLSYKTFIKQKFKDMIDNDEELKEKYNLYKQQFRTEDEAIYCIKYKDDLENHLCSQCNNFCTFYNINRGYRNTCGNKECIKKIYQSNEVREKTKKTCTDKYGKEYYFQTDKFKEQSKQTCKDKLGVEYPMQCEEIKNKQYDTMEKLYGTKHALQIKEFKEKAEQTCLDNLGTKNPFESEKIKELIKQRNKDKLGVENPMQCEEIKNKSIRNRILNNRFNLPFTNEDNEKILNIINNIYNINTQDTADILLNNEYFIKLIEIMYNEKNRLLRLQDISDILNFSEQAIKNHIEKLNLLNYFYIKDSELELQFKNFLDKNNIKYERRNRELRYDDTGFPLELDFILNDYNIALEINDIKSHNMKRCEDQNYHINKTIKTKKEKNINLIHLWEWELTDEELWRRTSSWILNLLNNHKININLSQCNIKEILIDEQKNFLEKYNLNGYKQSDVCIGLYYQNELLQLLSLKNKNDDNWEICQFTTKFEYEINNGIKELLNYLIKQYSIKSIILNYNLDKIIDKDISLIEKLGFKLLRYQEPSLISYNKYDSLYKSIYNCGQNIYILEL